MSATPGAGSRTAWLATLGPGLIDMHTHAIDPDLPDLAGTYPGSFPRVRRIPGDRAEILLGDRPYRVVDSRCWSAQARIKDMDAEGVAAQVVSATPVTLCHGEPAAGAAALACAQNDFMARLVAEAPGRLLGLGCVPMQDPGAAIAELRRCVTELGFAGVQIGTRVGELELADPRFVPFFQAVAELRALVFVHPVDRTLDPRLAALGLGFGLGMPAETAVAAAGLLVSDLFDQVPGLRLYLAHAGGTLPSALPRLARGQQLAGVAEPARLATERARRLWCDSLSYDAAGLLFAAERFGAGHVVLGTDYPFDAREQPAGAVLGLLESPADLAGVARENALALLSGAGI